MTRRTAWARLCTLSSLHTQTLAPTDEKQTREQIGLLISNEY